MTESAQTAKAIRQELKEKFPQIKFSVTSENYAGGNSVDIKYEANTPTEEIRKITDKYQKGQFDGITDSYIYNNKREDIPQVMFVFVKKAIN